MAELKIPEPFLQRDNEKYNLQLRKISGDMEDQPIAKYRGDMVRAAALLGWIEGVEPKGVGDLKAREVYLIAMEITELFTELVEVPKN